MILVSLGTTHMPFQRLVEGLSLLPAEDLVIQHGPAVPPPRVQRAVPFLEYGEMVKLMEQADAIVTHAGVGTVLDAIRTGHRPVVVPRRKRYRETVDDHQVDLCRALEQRGAVIPVWEMEQLPDAVATAARGTPPDVTARKPVHVALRAALQGRL